MKILYRAQRCALAFARAVQKKCAGRAARADDKRVGVAIMVLRNFLTNLLCARGNGNRANARAQVGYMELAWCVCVCLTALISSDENRFNALRVYSACSGTDGARCIVRVICHKARDVRFWDDFVQMERFPQSLTGYQIRYIHCPRLTSVWGGVNRINSRWYYEKQLDND